MKISISVRFLPYGFKQCWRPGRKPSNREFSAKLQIFSGDNGHNTVYKHGGMYGSVSVSENLANFTCKHTFPFLDVVVREPASFTPAFTFSPSIVRHLIRKVFDTSSVTKFAFAGVEYKAINMKLVAAEM